MTSTRSFALGFVADVVALALIVLGDSLTAQAVGFALIFVGLVFVVLGAILNDFEQRRAERDSLGPAFEFQNKERR